MKTYKRAAFQVLLAMCLATAPARGEELTIGWIGALTGDAAGIGNDILASLQTAVAEANSRGGIDGKKLRIIAEDDGYEVSRALTAYEKLKKEVSTKVIFASTYGALFALGTKPDRDGILVLDTLD